MEKYNIKWNVEIENFVRRIEELKKRELLKRLDELISTLPETKPTSAEMVRRIGIVIDASLIARYITKELGWGKVKEFIVDLLNPFCIECENED